jgi:L-alanine-DL-glutamate epimerase-like enolase superfamily enzyme
MSDSITGYELWRLEVPTGRMIGDNNCHYDSLDLVALCLKTEDGLEAWGYGETCWKGVFKIPAWYIQPMASQAEMRDVFEQEWFPRLPQADHKTKLPYLDAAVRQALWDLRAQQAGLPLYQFIGGKPGGNRVRAYGSILDFPLSEDEAVALAKQFVSRGFRAIKVKVGADNVERDIQRLHAIHNAIGPDVELTADANQIWDADTAIDRLRTIEASGIRLGYIEDPLPYTDVAGFTKLNAAVDIDVIGHDYAFEPGHIRALLETKGIERIRTGKDVDYSLTIAQLAAEFGKPMIFGNSMFEFNVHAACALPNVDRLEFSNLAWNELMREPVKFANGHAIAPEAPGHGLRPNPDVLKQWNREEVSI